MLIITSLLLGAAVAFLVGGLHTEAMWRLQGHLVAQDAVGNAGIGTDTPLVHVRDHQQDLWAAAGLAASAASAAVGAFGWQRKVR